MSFAAPGLLFWLLAIPVAIAAYALFERRREHRAAAWATPALLPNMVERPPSWRRHLPFALLLVGLALLLVGFARPKATHTVKRQQATLVLVMDVSGSMAAKDVQPSRLGAAKAVANRLVDKLPHGYRVAIVRFSDHSAVIVPPTQDLARVRQAIAGMQSGPQGTALAEAVAHAAIVAKSVPAQGSGSAKPPATIVVLTDGGATAGRVTPQQAAGAAAKAKAPVFSVLLGTPQGVVQQKLKGGFTERIEVPSSDIALQLFARATGGKVWMGPGATDPATIYHDLGSRTGTQRKSVEVTAAAAGGGIAFMLVGAALSGLWFRRLT